MTTPDVKAVDIDAGLGDAFAKAANGPEQVEEVNVWCRGSHQGYGQAVDGDASEDQPESKVGKLVRYRADCEIKYREKILVCNRPMLT